MERPWDNIAISQLLHYTGLLNLQTQKSLIQFAGLSYFEFRHSGSLGSSGLRVWGLGVESLGVQGLLGGEKVYGN